MTDPAQVAARVIEETLRAGSSKDGSADAWRRKPGFFHLLKASRHLTTHTMQIMGVAEADGENHLRLAITRLAMALAQQEGDHGDL